MRTMIALCLVMLAGCATSPVSMQNAEPVPPDRIFALQKPAAVTVTVVRDKGYMAHGCGVNAAIDGTRAAFIAAGEKVRLHVDTGTHLIAVWPSDRGLCGINADAQRRTLKFDARAGESPQFRISVLSSGDLMIAQTQ